MAKKNKTRIGFLMYNDDVGVVYYLSNIVQCLRYLSELEQPQIILFYSSDMFKYLDLFYDYGFIEFVELEKPTTIRWIIDCVLSKSNFFINQIQQKYELNGLFPVNDILFKNTSKDFKLVSWITDFQHKFLPENFKWVNRVIRDIRFKLILKYSNTVVLSSQDSLSHLKQFYRISSVELRVLNFVSHAHLIAPTPRDIVISKYSISRVFFIVSNQFYRHKNHLIVLKAIVEVLKAGYQDFEVIFTGKKEDYRDATFFPSIEKFIENNNIGGNVKILGLIPREDQLALINMSLAIIQPSFFEGWNSSIEDAKTLGKQVICSDIQVHKEQLGTKGFYFSGTKESELANIMISFLQEDVPLLKPFDDFSERVHSFLSSFIKIFNED